MRSPLLAGLALLAGLLSPIARGQELPGARPGAAPPPAPREIAEIRVTTSNVFDETIPSENRWFYRLVNAIHFTTKQDFLAGTVPLRVGQAVTPDEIAEAERILRRFGFLREVNIRAVDRPDGRIDLEVTTRDAWTTKIGLSLGGGGGETHFKVGLEETNVLGYGKELSFEFEQTSLRSTNSFSYEDPRFLDTNMLLRLVYLNNSDGDGWKAHLGLPLLRGADPHGWTVDIMSLTDVVPVYHDGEEASRIRRDTKRIEAEAVWTWQGSATETKRYGVGLAALEETFEPIELGSPEDVPLDVDRMEIYVLARHRLIRFRSEAYLNRFSRVEDISTGLDAELQVGISPDLLAGEENVWHFAGRFGQGFDTFKGNFGTARLDFSIFHGSRDENRTGKVDLDAVAYFRPDLWRDSLHPLGVAHVRYGIGWNLPPHERYLLGGDNGLRGFDAHAWDGERLLLLNCEYRVSGEREWLKLVQLGAAGFIDTGVADDHDVLDPGRWKASVGVGLRFGIPRAAKNNVLRVDIAYPLHSDAQGKRGFVYSFGSGQAF